MSTILRPGLWAVSAACGIPAGYDVETLMLAVALQESGLNHRYQVVRGGVAGPARGWWQFETTGVRAVMRHERTARHALTLCAFYAVTPEPGPVWRALEGHDALAVGFARLLLWCDPTPLPTEQGAAWDYYERLWRPGNPRPEAWCEAWVTALSVVDGATR